MDASNVLGIWAVDSAGSLRVVIREGDIVEGKKLRSFVALSATPGSLGVTRSFNNRAKLIYRATFTDGASAVVETTIP